MQSEVGSANIAFRRSPIGGLPRITVRLWRRLVAVETGLGTKSCPPSHLRIYVCGIMLDLTRQGVLRRLHVLNDLHMEAGDYTPEQTDADVVILAGDISVGCGGIQWAKEHFPKPARHLCHGKP